MGCEINPSDQGGCYSTLSTPPRSAPVVNTRGGIGRNIPCDLYEFVNKLLKHIITSMGSNITEESLQRAARSVSTLQAICKKFDHESSVPIGTQAHSTKSDVQDVAKVIAVVIDRSFWMFSKEEHTNLTPISN